MERAGQTAWVLDYLDDLDADFLRFYRVDYTDLTGPRFFSLAARVGVYGGMMTERIRQTEVDEVDPMPAIAADAKQVPLTELTDLIEMG